MSVQLERNAKYLRDIITHVIVVETNQVSLVCSILQLDSAQCVYVRVCACVGRERERERESERLCMCEVHTCAHELTSAW